MSSSPLRIVFFGTPAFAAPTLARLLDSPHQVVGVVTQPDRARGRGQKVSEAPVKALAVERGIAVLQPEKLRRDEWEAPLAALGADIGVVAAYGKILPDWLLAQPRLGLINVHASLLPRHRGAAPVHRAVMAGDAVTGVTIMRVVKALDAGAMMAVVETPIGPDETSVEVEQRLATLGADLLMDVVHRLAQGPVDEIPQDDQAATYAPKITREDGPLDWTRPAQALHDQVRGLHPWPHASTTLEGQRLIVHRSRVGGPATEPVAPGTVVAAARGTLAVACGDGRTLDLLVIQPEGRRAMAAAEFLAGHRVVPGVRLGR
ncbi:MAG: methionyl-tRNA formyltransferase [Vicinamibacteria bacterium]